LSAFRSFDFDAAVVVLLDEHDYGVTRAVTIPASAIRALDTWREHTHSYSVHANAALLDHSDALDVTDLLQAAAST
jgi:hypothetical protein